MNSFVYPLKHLAVFEDMKKDLNKHGKAVLVTGCVEQQKAHLVFGVCDTPFRLIITHNEIRARQLYEEYRFFDRNVVYYPAKDFIFYNADIHGNLIVKERINAIKHIAEHKKAQREVQGGEPEKEKQEEKKMRMMLVGAGAVGESILKVMQWRDPKGEWLKYVLVCDYDLKRAEEVVGMMKGDSRFEASKIDATNTEEMAELIREHKIDFVMDVAPPFASNMIFDAAFKTGADYGSMGTWSVPMEDPAYGLGIENSYTEPMTKYNFDRHEAWKKQGNMAVICMGIDPGVVNVFAKYAATELLDEITEVHVKDGGNLSVPGADPDDIMFGFNVWTVLDEVMNPNVEYDKEKGGFIVEKAFAGQEVYEMPEGVGKNTLVKVEHEEVVTMARYLSQYGLKKATFKISLDENLITALKVLDKLGLRSIKPVQVGDVKVVPRDVVAACAPQPKDIGDEMTGKMLVGVQCIGKKDGKEKEYFLYQPFDNQESIERWGTQAVTAQTGFGAALALELIGRGIWKEAGVYAPEYFDPKPYLELMKESGYKYGIIEK